MFCFFLIRTRINFEENNFFSLNFVYSFSVYFCFIEILINKFTTYIDIFIKNSHWSYRKTLTTCNILQHPSLLTLSTFVIICNHITNIFYIKFIRLFMFSIIFVFRVSQFVLTIEFLHLSYFYSFPFFSHSNNIFLHLCAFQNKSTSQSHPS